MIKIPTLFKRTFDDNHVVYIEPVVTPGFEWVLAGEGIATVKWDGSCCAVFGGQFFKRYDAKHGKPIPKNAVKCQPEPDPITGHLPCWMPCSREDPGDKWFWAAYDNYLKTNNITPAYLNGTYEAIGRHFRNNPYGLDYDTLIKHGQDVINVPRSFEGIRDYLASHNIEGIVFWQDAKPQCKIKRNDFGFKWNS